MSAVMGDGKDKKGANDEPEPPGEATPAKKSKPNPAPPPAEVARGNHTNPNLQVNCISKIFLISYPQPHNSFNCFKKEIFKVVLC